MPNVASAYILKNLRRRLVAGWHSLRTSAASEVGAAQAAMDEAGASLDRGIDLLKFSVDRTAPQHRLRPARLTNLGAALVARYEQHGSPIDLEAAIEVHEQAVALSAHHDPNRVTMLSNAGMALHLRHELRGSKNDLERAAAVLKIAYEQADDTHPERVAVMVNWSAILIERFLAGGERQDLHTAVALLTKARELAEKTSDEADICANLGSALHTLFATEGDAAVLDDAVAAHEDAVAIASAAGRETARLRSALGSALRARYVLLGRRSDLDASVEAHREALERTPRSHPSYAQRLSSLATSLASLHERTGSLDVLDETISLLDQAVGLTLEGRGERIAHLRNLGVALTTRAAARDAANLVSDQGAASDDVDRAVNTLVEAKLGLSTRSELWPGVTSSLAHAYGERYDLTADSADLDAAIDAHKAAARRLPEDHADRARMLTDAGDALRQRYDSNIVTRDLRDAYDSYMVAASSGASPPRDRARAAFRQGQVARELGEDEHAATAFRDALHLFELVVPGWLPTSDARHLLSDLSGTASEAAAAYLDIGDVEGALEMLEQGRGLLLSYALNRSRPTGLAQLDDPDLAARYLRIIDALNRPSAESAPITDYRAARAELDKLLQRIRQRPGLSGFGQRATVHEMALAGLPAPVVLLNVTDARCDALILTGTGIDALPLPQLTLEDALAQAARFTGAVARRNDYALRSVLAWLWDAVAEPVLLHLGYSTPADGPPVARIIWSPTGPLVGLPLHAAGHHRSLNDSGGPLATRTVLDRVVSSYTPTVRAITRPLDNDASPAPCPSILVVSMPTTPGELDLPRARDDAEVIAARADGYLQLLGPEQVVPATFATVAASLEDHTWVHFSCHAISDFSDPSRSRLLLQDHRTRPMTVASVASFDVLTTELAFLSSCTTAGAHPELSDEPIHLAASFLGLGARHVIATLWPVSDSAAALATRAVYDLLLTGADGLESDAAGAAAAVHAACLELRRQSPGRPARWAAYVHFGP